MIEDDSYIIPIDVKKSKGKLNSLDKFCEHNKLNYAVKVSKNNYGYDSINNVLTIPFYFLPIFLGIPENDIVSIGTVGGSPRKLIDRFRFEKGLSKMVEVLKLHTILVYGSANYTCFNKLRELGIKVIEYQSKTSKDFERLKNE